MAAITTAAIGAGTAIYAAKKQGDAAKEANKIAKEGTEAADPLKQYRPEYAQKLDALIKDPSSIQDTAEYKARQQAVARQLAAQGYTGSGNALIEAADAGGQSYQQAFQNLYTLAGGTPGGGYDTAAQASLAGSDMKANAIAGVANNLTNLGATIGASGKFNKAATANTVESNVNTLNKASSGTKSFSKTGG